MSRTRDWALAGLWVLLWGGGCRTALPIGQTSRSKTAPPASNAPSSGTLLQQSYEQARQSLGAKPEIQAFDGLDRIVAAGLSQDGGTLTVADQFGYGRFDLEHHVATGRTLARGRLQTISSDGSHALMMIPGDDQPEWHCLDTTTGEVLPSLLMPNLAFEVYEQQIGVALSPDGTRAAAYVTWRAGSDNADSSTRVDHVVVWNCRTASVDGVLAPGQDYADLVSSLSFSPSGRLLGLSGRAGTVVVWDVEQKTVLLDDADSSCPQCDATEMLSLNAGHLFWALTESVLITESSNANRRWFGLTKGATASADIPENLVGVLPDDHTLLSRSATLDLRTNVTSDPPAGDWGGLFVGGRWFVRSGVGHGQVVLSSLGAKGHQILAERHSDPFDAMAVKNGTLIVGGRAALHFDLPDPATAAKRKSAWEVRSGEASHIELRDTSDASNTWKPWLPCVGVGRSLYWVPPSVMAVPCGTEIVFSTTNQVGAATRLRHIEGTDTAYALFADGTAELFGSINDLRRVARCVIGPLSFPLELCEDEMLRPGKLQELLLQKTLLGAR